MAATRSIDTVCECTYSTTTHVWAASPIDMDCTPQPKKSSYGGAITLTRFQCLTFPQVFSGEATRPQLLKTAISVPGFRNENQPTNNPPVQSRPTHAVISPSDEPGKSVEKVYHCCTFEVGVQCASRGESENMKLEGKIIQTVGFFARYERTPQHLSCYLSWRRAGVLRIRCFGTILYVFLL